ncbi:hypothetical protein F4778DRAFT_261714 [Xylariomycetidae sp. FL2044]|nr:hypothetical protein F4778DRAFT_261714 [Xylariomycetidae sp. FL2044]
MGDPLSIAASIAGLSQLAGTAYIQISKYVKHAREARNKVLDLARELRTISGVLQSLSLLAETLDKSEHKTTGLSVTCVSDCEATILKIKVLVDQAQKDFSSGRKRDAVLRSLAFPLSEDTLRELLDDMRRHKETLNMALNADTLQKLLDVGRDQAAIYNSVNVLRFQVKQRFEIETRLEMDDNRRKVLDFFVPVDPQVYLDASRKLRQPATGEWLTKRNVKFLLWQQMDGAKLWLRGIAGSGKTVMCGTVIQEILGLSNESTAICYFFCDYKNPKSHMPENILAAFAAQLARQKDHCFDMLDEYHRELRSTRGVHNAGQLEAQRLESLFGSMASSYDKVFLIVDALDECGNYIDDVTTCLKAVADKNPNINTALFSRDNDGIRDALIGFEEINIAAQSSDLELYIAAEMTRRKEMMESEPETRRKIHDTLVEQAHGM